MEITGGRRKQQKEREAHLGQLVVPLVDHVQEVLVVHLVGFVPPVEARGSEDGDEPWVVPTLLEEEQHTHTHREIGRAWAMYLLMSCGFRFPCLQWWMVRKEGKKKEGRKKGRKEEGRKEGKERRKEGKEGEKKEGRKERRDGREGENKDERKERVEERKERRMEGRKGEKE